MDFEKNPLMNDTSRCRREVKRWLALVALTLAALLTGMVSAVTAPSPASREIANFLMIASVTAIICSLFGVKQSNDHCRSVQYGLSVFEAMKKDLEGTESELTSARYDVTDAQSDLYFAKKNAEALQDELASVKSELEETRGRLYEAENELAQTQECLYRTENVLEETRDWLCETDDALVQTRDQLNETKRQRDGLQSERDDLQSKLNTARIISVRRLIERNELQDQNDGLRKELHEAKMDLEWSRGLHANAKALIAGLKRQITDLEKARSERDDLQGRNDDLCKKLNASTEKVDWLRREYFKVWRKTLRQSYNAKRQAVNLESILKNLDEATEIADLREKLKMVINGLSAEDSRE